MISAIVDHSGGLTWVKISSTSMSSSFFTFPVCHEVGIRNIGTSVSTCVEVNLSALKIQNEKVSIQYLFQFLLRYKVHEMQVLFSHDPPASFPYTIIFIDRGSTGQIS